MDTNNIKQLYAVAWSKYAISYTLLLFFDYYQYIRQLNSFVKTTRQRNGIRPEKKTTTPPHRWYCRKYLKIQYYVREKRRYHGKKTVAFFSDFCPLLVQDFQFTPGT